MRNKGMRQGTEREVIYALDRASFNQGANAQYDFELIELIQESVGGCSTYWAGLIADHLLASIRELDAEHEAGLTIRNLQLESELKQLRDKIAESKPQWIPVSERLPEVDGRYLAISSVLNVNYIGIFGFSKDLYKVDGRDFKKYKQKKKSGFFSHVIRLGFFEERDITYWMPLPEPPKEEV